MRFSNLETTTSVRELTRPMNSNTAAKPYRVGIFLLCVGALINWLGYAQDYYETFQSVGIICIILGIFLVVSSACFWTQYHEEPNLGTSMAPEVDSISPEIFIISIDDTWPKRESLCTLPPDYESLGPPPPTYDDAIKIELSKKEHVTDIKTVLV